MHPIEILEKEHEEILANIDKMEEIVSKIKGKKGFEEIENELSELKKVAHLFLDADNHHKREEDVLFPAMESKGIQGPTYVMRSEHDELRAKKRQLDDAVKAVPKIGFSEFLGKVEDSASFIQSVLREHIMKENNILYPMAQNVIDESEWEDIGKKFDEIGYCCFSPTAIKTHNMEKTKKHTCSCHH